ncbi:MAG: hypothetical protein FWG63_01500 [Defluviitaleaceae bacterium]|nr:hypothetical protein [Defluviitaleaceae bacterium]
MSSEKSINATINTEQDVRPRIKTLSQQEWLDIADMFEDFIWPTFLEDMEKIKKKNNLPLCLDNLRRYITAAIEHVAEFEFDEVYIEDVEEAEAIATAPNTFEEYIKICR